LATAKALQEASDFSAGASAFVAQRLPPPGRRRCAMTALVARNPTSGSDIP
jgi:hypothetical protein